MTVDAAENLLPSQSPSPPRFRPEGQFPKDHFWDRWFYPLFVGLIWLGVGLGFGPELVQHIKGGEAPYPPVVHLHAAAFRILGRPVDGAEPVNTHGPSGDSPSLGHCGRCP